MHGLGHRGVSTYDDSGMEVRSGGEPGHAPRTGEGRGRVLVIGSDGGAQRILRRFLDLQDVVTASDGRRALSMLDKDADFDLLLCDAVMPGLTGVEFWSEVVFKHPSLIDRIVFVTHGVQSTGDEAFLSSGAVQVLREPYSLESLRRLVAEYVEGAVASW